MITEEAQHEGWYVAMSRVGCESLACHHLQAQGFECYLPLSVSVSAPVPLFPRYLFVRPGSPDQSLCSVRSTRGVSHLVRFGPDLAFASGAMVEEVRRLEALCAGGLPDALRAGETVEILRGPFAGYDAEVLRSGTDRVIVLMRVLGSIQQVAVPRADARKVS